MRLIDADAMRNEWLKNDENEYFYDTNSVLESIDQQPTIDAVPVVRCKDCMFSRREDGMQKGYRKCVNVINEGSKQWRSMNDFCSYGYKKGKNMDLKCGKTAHGKIQPACDRSGT